MSFDWSQSDSHFDGIGRITREGEERAHVDWGVGSDYQPPKKLFPDDGQDSSPLTDDSSLADRQFMGLANLFNDGNEERVLKFLEGLE